MGFSRRLRQGAEGVWRAQLEHPFIRGIADGSLGVDRFRFWIRQDYLFLIEYCRLLALAAARAPDLPTLRRLSGLLQATAGQEMDLHRAYAAEFGISAGELEGETAAPATRAYCDFLLRVAATGDFAELASALLPCMWAFSEIGRHLAELDPPAHARYQKWIEMYSSPEFQEEATWCQELVDRLAQGAGDRVHKRMEAAFMTSCRYELAFWEMAWTGADARESGSAGED